MNSNTIFRLYTQGRSICFIVSPGNMIFAVLEQHDCRHYSEFEFLYLHFLLEYHVMGQIKVKLYCILKNCHFPLTYCVALTTVYALPCNTVMGLFRTVSEVNGDFSRKSEIFPPLTFDDPAEGVQLKFCNGGSADKPGPCP